MLILAPIGRDAQAAAAQLGASGFECAICSGVDDLHKKLDEGAAVALVTEEAFVRDNSNKLAHWVQQQHPWSDFPFIMLTTNLNSTTTHAYRLRLLEGLGNVSLLERPLNAVTMVSAIRAAIRARERQYEVRDHLSERELMSAQLEDLVRDRTQQLEATNHQLRQQIAERKQAEAALQQAQKMEVIGQLTGGVAHDFNNLLTAVLGNLELATRRAKDDGIRRFLDGATHAAQRGAKITSQLLAFSRAQRLQTEPTDVNTLVTGMSELLLRTLGGTVRIETILEKALWPATADPSQVELVILTLAVNARDSMPEGGKLTVSTANTSMNDDSKPGELSPGDYVAISVGDNGSGMTNEVLQKAFEPFFTTKPVGSGTGLGLSQVYGIAKQSGGAVSIKTKLGQGTTVTIYLPRAQNQPALHQLDHSREHFLQRPEATVLVVDDDPDVRQTAVAFLEGLGYLVRSAESGRAALHIMDGDARFDLLLIDIAMPEIGGPETVKEIHKKRPDLPVLYMTGYVGATYLEELERHVLKKPFTITKLAAEVEEVLSPTEVHSFTTDVISIKAGDQF